MSMYDNKPQVDDWIVDVEINGKSINDPLWGKQNEITILLKGVVQMLRGIPRSNEVIALVEQMNELETDKKTRYVITQEPKH